MNVQLESKLKKNKEELAFFKKISMSHLKEASLEGAIESMTSSSAAITTLYLAENTNNKKRERENNKDWNSSPESMVDHANNDSRPLKKLSNLQ